MIENDGIDETGIGPTTRRIQFYVRDIVGALASAFKIFGVSLQGSLATKENEGGHVIKFLSITSLRSSS